MIESWCGTWLYSFKRQKYGGRIKGIIPCLVVVTVASNDDCLQVSILPLLLLKNYEKDRNSQWLSHFLDWLVDFYTLI